MSFSTGSGTPMMPVELGKISSKTQPSCVGEGDAGALAGVDAGVAGGAVGVAGVDEHGADLIGCRWRRGGLRPTVMGAATIWFEVNMAAAGVAPVGAVGDGDVGLAGGLEAGGGGGPA